MKTLNLAFHKIEPLIKDLKEYTIVKYKKDLKKAKGQILFMSINLYKNCKVKVSKESKVVIFDSYLNFLQHKMPIHDASPKAHGSWHFKKVTLK